MTGMTTIFLVGACEPLWLGRTDCGHACTREAGKIRMAKGQKRSNKELRKPKASTPKKNNVSAPSAKARGLSTAS